MKHVYNILPVPCEKSKIVSFTSLRMKDILFPALSKCRDISRGVLLLVSRYEIPYYYPKLIKS